MKLDQNILDQAKETVNIPTEKLENPIMIQMMGAPSWGKTFLAKKIASSVPIVRISGDSIRKKIFPQAEFSESENRFIYDDVIPVMIEELSKEGHSVIIDANVNKRVFRKKNAEQADKLGMRSLTILVKCSDEVAKKRLTERRKNPWKLVQSNEYVVPAEAYDSIKKEVEMPSLLEKSFTFNSEKEESKKFAKLLKYLKK